MSLGYELLLGSTLGVNRPQVTGSKATNSDCSIGRGLTGTDCRIVSRLPYRSTTTFVKSSIFGEGILTAMM